VNKSGRRDHGSPVGVQHDPPPPLERLATFKLGLILQRHLLEGGAVAQEKFEDLEFELGGFVGLDPGHGWECSLFLLLSGSNGARDAAESQPPAAVKRTAARRGAARIDFVGAAHAGGPRRWPAAESWGPPVNAGRDPRKLADELVDERKNRVSVAA
jgi:hypothetical protein